LTDSYKKLFKSNGWYHKIWISAYSIWITNAAFTLNGFDDQERNLMFVKMDFQVLKLKFLAYNMKQAFYPLQK